MNKYKQFVEETGELFRFKAWEYNHKKQGAPLRGSISWTKQELYIKWKLEQAKLNKIKRLLHNQKTDISTGGTGGWITIHKNAEMLSKIKEVFEDEKY